MKLLLSPTAIEQPFETPPPKARAVGDAFSEDWWGAFSIQKFCDVGGLSYTHADAQGWLAYLMRFHADNFWFQDGNVQAWAYYEDYDNWQDTYGMDAVLAAYHSGHGGMDGKGVFYAPVGADWNHLGCTVTSNNMRLGNEQVNYIFWSTCSSCRVLDGQNPIRTWSPANLGFRMLFGYETTSWDSADYGKNFWNEWNKGKSFSSAWLDAGWDVAHDQAPSAVAVGATADEARSRVFDERIMSWGHASTNYWWWRWYYAATAARATRDPHRALPTELLIAELRPVVVSEELAKEVIKRHGLSIKLPAEAAVSAAGTLTLAGGDQRLAFGEHGRYDVHLARPNIDNRTQIALDRAQTIAQETVKRHGLGGDVTLTFDRIRHAAEGGGAVDGGGQMEGPFVTETAVQFRQVINGLPVITPSDGVVRVTVDNDGTVTSIHNSTRPIARLVDRPKNSITVPMNGATNGTIGKLRTADVAGYETLLSEEWTKRVAYWAVEGKMPLHYTVVPGSTEVGYDIRGNQAIIVARRAVEVDFGNGYLKRYWVVVPLLQ